MHSDFAANGKIARNAIAVPGVPIEWIRRRSRAAAARERFRAIVACAAVGLGAVAAAAYGEKMYEGVSVWISGDKGAAVVKSLVQFREPMAADLRDTIARATFRVVLPMGLPAGSQVRWILYTPADHPTLISMTYVRPDHRVASITLVDSSIVNALPLPNGPAKPRFWKVNGWRIGGETVQVSGMEARWGNLAAMEAAMRAASPAESFAATERMLPKVIALSAAVRFDVAERVRPAVGASVLLEARQVRSIERSPVRPIYDTRMATITNIPYVGGVPDYEKASVSFPRTVLIGAAGVRAIREVLATGGRDCDCDVLFNRPNASMYWIWVIPASGPPRATKYSVDAKSLSVTREG